MDFFNSLWSDPEQSEIPHPHNFAVDLTTEKWMSLSSTYKLISGSLKHPQDWLAIDKYFKEGTQKKGTSEGQPYFKKKKKQKKQKKQKVTTEATDGDTEKDEVSENDSEDEDTPKNKYVYIPGLRKNPNEEKMSCLNAREHEECMYLFKKFSVAGNVIMRSDRAEYFKFEVLYKRVQDEQKKFMEDASNKWQEKFKEVQNVPDAFVHSLGLFWKIKSKKALERYPHFYKKISMVPLQSGDIKIEMTKMSDLLQMGTIPSFLQPALQNRTKPNVVLPRLLHAAQYHFRPDQFVGSLHKLPVSMDPNAESLARLKKAQIVISSGALNALLETHFNSSKQWALPISVKEYRTIDKGKTTTKTVVFIDKPLPKQSMTAEECYRFVNKLGIKSRLLGRKKEMGFTFPIPGVSPFTNQKGKTPNPSQDSNAELKNDTEEKGKEPAKIEKMEDNSDNESEDEKLVIEDLLEDTNREKKISGNDGLRVPKTPEGYTVPLSTTNVTYSSWIIKPENADQYSVHQKKALKELLVIIRNRVDGCQKIKGVLAAVSISPKTEYQLEYAGEEPTKEELVREWASVNFKPASLVARLRVDVKDGEMVMCEKKDKSQIVSDAQRMHGIRLRDSVQTLYSVFSEVSTLSKGSYLLHHSAEDNAFASLEEETKDIQENGKSVRNLEKYFNQNFAVVCDPNTAWRKLDCTLVLPRHEKLKLMPATYRPKRGGKSFVARNIPKKAFSNHPVSPAKKKFKMKKKNNKNKNQQNDIKKK